MTGYASTRIDAILEREFTAYAGPSDGLSVFASVADPAKARMKRAEMLICIRRQRAYARSRGMSTRCPIYFAKLRAATAAERRLRANPPAFVWDGYSLRVMA